MSCKKLPVRALTDGVTALLLNLLLNTSHGLNMLTERLASFIFSLSKAT